jgi:hypothetical protein
MIINQKRVCGASHYHTLTPSLKHETSKECTFLLFKCDLYIRKIKKNDFD